MSSAFANTPIPTGELVSQDREQGPKPRWWLIFHCSVLGSGCFTKTSNSWPSCQRAERSWTKLSILTLTRVRERTKKFCTL